MKTNIQVLILEDRPLDAELMVRELRRAGFDPDWIRVDTETAFLEQLQPGFDVILADFTMPRLNALCALNLLQERGLDIPFIVVSGSIGEETAVAAMKQGASDYLLKDRLARLGQAVANTLKQTELRTEKRRVEEALRHNEKKFRALAETTPSLIVIHQGGKICYANPAAETILGYAVATLQQMNFWEVIHPDFRELVRRRGSSREHGESPPNRYEFKIVTRHGQERWLDCAAAVIEFEHKPAVLATAFDITERKLFEEKIQASLREKEVMLNEIHHRVKNNLQVICSLLNLQSASITDPKTRQIFQESQDRIQSMALIHAKLYETENLSRIDFADYLRKLLVMVFRSYNSKSKSVRPELHFDRVWLGLDLAVPMGLITHELVSNCLKHGFPEDRSGVVRVELHADDQQQVILSVADDGVGLPEDFRLEKIGTLGLRLVKLLAEQIGSQLEFHSVGGAQFKITSKACAQP